MCLCVCKDLKTYPLLWWEAGEGARPEHQSRAIIEMKFVSRHAAAELRKSIDGLKICFGQLCQRNGQMQSPKIVPEQVKKIMHIWIDRKSYAGKTSECQKGEGASPKTIGEKQK